jgi:hypothetical protein
MYATNPTTIPESCRQHTTNRQRHPRKSPSLMHLEKAKPKKKPQPIYLPHTRHTPQSSTQKQKQYKNKTPTRQTTYPLIKACGKRAFLVPVTPH